ncbi:MAG: hypothetical protein FIA97_14280 [Methylococcaceae bacterium]|nr:hypothetical protein [Methylococcaceae bacterium]
MNPIHLPTLLFFLMPAVMATPRSDASVPSPSDVQRPFASAPENPAVRLARVAFPQGALHLDEDPKPTGDLANASIDTGTLGTSSTRGAADDLPPGPFLALDTSPASNPIAASRETDGQLTQPTPRPAGATSKLKSILADMGPSDAKGHGIETWAPSKGGIVEYALPSGYGAATGWGSIYRDTSDAADINTRVALKDYKVYVLDKSGHWTLASSPANAVIAGDRWPENFGGNPIGNDTRIESDGSLSQKLLHGYCWHFFTARFPVDSSKIAGIISTVSVRLVMDDPALPDDRNKARYLIAMGGDWWRTVTAEHIAFNKDPALTNAAEMGWSRFKYITGDWQTISFTNIPVALLNKYPPPF